MVGLRVCKSFDPVGGALERDVCERGRVKTCCKMFPSVG